MLIGIWKNFQELEEQVSLPELEAILNASHEREHRQNRFAAAMKGINIDAPSQEEAKERFEASQRRADAINTGKTVEEIEYDELGLDIEKE